MQSATQSAMHNCAVGLGFRVCSPYRHGRDCSTPKPGKKKQKRYDYACAVLIDHRFPFSFLCLHKYCVRSGSRLGAKMRKCVKPVRALNRNARARSPFFHEASFLLNKSLEAVRIEQDPVRVSTPVQFHGPLRVPQTQSTVHPCAQRHACRRHDARPQSRLFAPENQ